MTTKKVTKRTYLATLEEIVSFAKQEGVELPENVTFEGLSDFIGHELELLDNRAAGAAKRQAEKRAAGDELRERVLNALSTEVLMSVDEIVDAIGDPDVRKNMVIARLTQLGEKGLNVVERGKVKVETDSGKTHEVAAYRRIA